MSATKKKFKLVIIIKITKIVIIIKPKFNLNIKSRFFRKFKIRKLINYWNNKISKLIITIK